MGPYIKDVKNIYIGNWAEMGVSATQSGADGKTDSDGDPNNGTAENLAIWDSSHADGTGIRIKQFTDTGKDGIFLIPATRDEYWNLTAVDDGDNANIKLYFKFGDDYDDTALVNRGYISSVSGNVKMNNFTGQHRCEDFSDELTDAEVGLIVVSSGQYNNETGIDKPTINESLPIVKLSSKRNQKSCFGVLSDKEDRNGGPREYKFGCFVSVDQPEETLNRLIVNSLGEGAIWVCNINGNLENGDYITTCEIPGHGMLQDDDLLHNYTVAKITQDCTFELDNPYYDCVEFEFEGNTYRKAFVGCTYHCG